MNIGIAINGEGRGHFSRARALAEILCERHTISFWVPEHLASELAGYFPKAAIHHIPYLKYMQRGFNLDYAATIAVNASLFLFPQRARQKIARQLREADIGMVLSDFEPFSSAAAKQIGLPVLQLNHPGIVTRAFSFSPAAIVARIVSAYMMAYSDRTVLCSFFGGDVGPIIRKELREKRITRGDYVLVYQKPMYREYLEPVLASLPDQAFRIFPDPKADYAEALAGCKALVAPAGHQSISEALALGKPVFVIPVKAQFEQELNAQKLRESGFGDYSFYDSLGTALPAFLSSLGTFENAIANGRMSGAHSPKKAWSCADETHRAAALVENFIRASAHAPEWKRRTVLAPLFQE